MTAPLIEPAPRAQTAPQPPELPQLARRYLAPGRALGLWLLTALLVLGCVLAVPGVGYMSEGEPFGVVVGAVLLGIALALAVPSVLILADGIREEADARDRLHDEAAAGDAVAVTAWHTPARALFWFLPSLVLCCTGLALAGTLVVSGSGSDAMYPAVLAITGILTTTGALGLLKSVDYYRLVARRLTG
ncbi:hypothetical protein ACQUSR_12985 [Streptomyces sp. P1-3]|uniref:hypothetical protein n=1 Tax=Streptomyces sp. P1-3 TaxID=3421658 RepID=UPI003D36B4BA